MCFREIGFPLENGEARAVVGRAGVSHREGFPNPELVFLIGVPWQGRGYAAEVCGVILGLWA